MIFKFEIEAQILLLKSQGIDAVKEDYIIMTHPSVRFDEDIYPLEITTNDLVPANACYLMKRPKYKVKTSDPFKQLRKSTL